MSTQVLSPFPLFTSLIGAPLTLGYVYIGVENQDPETHPQQAYWDIGLATPATQPLRTNGGYVVNAGNAATVYTNGAFSIRVRDKNGVQVFYRASVPSADALATLLASAAGAGMIGFGQDQTYSAGTLGKHNQIFVSVTDAPFNAKGDGVTDDTSAILAAISFIDGTGGTLVFPGGTYLVSIITFGGSDYNIDTSAGVLFKQKTGVVADVLGPPAVVRFISATRVTCGNFRVQGNIASDTGEDHHAAVLSMCKSVTIGRIFATNVRGDGLYCYARNTSDAERQRGCYVEEVSGTNVFRNLLSVVGGQLRVSAVINAGPVGFRDFDVEPNNSSGTYEAVDLQVDYAQVGSVDITSDDAATINRAIRIGSFDADFTRVQATTPPYPTAPGSGAYALGIARTQAIAIGYFKARNYNVYPISLGMSWASLDVGTWDVANCALGVTGVSQDTLIYQIGNAGAGKITIRNLIASAANTKMLGRVQGTGLLKIEVQGITQMQCLIGIQLTGKFANGTIDINSSTGTALANSSNVTFENVTTINHASATATSGCTGIVGIDTSYFGSTADGVNMIIGGAVRVAGTKVVGVQQPAINDVAAGGTTDTNARTTLNALLAAMRVHGLIAP